MVARSALAGLLQLVFVALFTANLVTALPPFAPPASQRGANVKRQPTKRELLAAQSIFQSRIAEQAKQVASKYPVDHIGNISDYSKWDQFKDPKNPLDASRGKTGSSPSVIENDPVSRQRPDLLAPPSTDSGSIPNAVWPFALSHNRLQNGGWAREQNKNVLPIATEMAAVNMKLEEGAYRELHWHKDAEWSYVLKGKVRVGAVNADGQAEVNDVEEGGLWYFPAGVPHYIQAISPGGAEFLLVFDSGSFSEDATLLLSDMVAHIPREVLVKNFDGALTNEDLDKFPASELYIFPAEVPKDDQKVESPSGNISPALTYQFSKQEKVKQHGGWYKVVDSKTTFPASKTIAAAEVYLEPGAMRGLHWHPLSDEWGFVISGSMRITVFAGVNRARTYNLVAGDTYYLQSQNAHYLEVVGDESARFLEIFKSDRFSDVSVSNWLALTPPKVVKDHLGLDPKKLERFKNKDYQVVSLKD